MNFKSSTLICLLPLVLLCGSAWAGPAQEFNQGWRAFHKLCKDKEKSRYRSHWKDIKKHFQKAYKSASEGPYAPKSLYYLGRTYEELGKRSYLESDFRQAIDYFQREINHFPHHSWTDDSQMHKAKIYYNYLDDPRQAYIEFLKIVHNYPEGDMRSEAEKILSKLDKKNTGELDKEEISQEKIGKEKKDAPSPSRASPKKNKKNTSLPALKDIRHWSSDEYTRVVLDLNRETEYYHKLLDPDPKLGTPHRLFIDLSETRLGEDTTRKEKIADGILKRVRAAQYRKDTARVVLDIQKLDRFRVFSLQNPFRIVVDVYAPPHSAKQKSTSKKVKLDSANKDMAKDNLVEQLGLTIETIMLDPGHGGNDPGAVSNGIMEKDLNLKMAKILGKMLREKGFKVLYTRKEDTSVPLEERTAMANSQKADLFLSIHCNAHDSQSVRGFEVYYLNLAKSEDAVRVAARENSISEKKISDLQYILTDLMLNSKISESRDLAGYIHETTIRSGKKSYSNLNDHGVRQAPFYVLMGAKMPAILVELGYITNSRDRTHLKSRDFLRRMSRGLVRGIVDYKEKMEKYAQVD